MTFGWLWRRRVVLVCMVAIVSLGPAACGDDGEEAQPTARQTLSSALSAFAKQDVNTLCGLLSRKAKLVIGHAQHNSLPLDCRMDVRPFVGAFQPYGNGWKPEIATVTRQAPDRAVAVYRLPEGKRARVTLRREQDRWKVDGFFDAGLSRIQLSSAMSSRGLPVTEKDLLAKDPAPPPAPPASMSVREQSSGRRCPDVAQNRFPKLAGGCLLRFSGARQRFMFETPFGVMHVGRCRITFDLRVDGGGRAWIDDYRIHGRSPCLDFYACIDRDFQAIPWRAALRSGPARAIRLQVRNVCLDTCFGRFSGQWDLGLVEGPKGWRVRSGAIVGSSGLRVDGNVTSKDRAILVSSPPKSGQRAATKPAQQTSFASHNERPRLEPGARFPGRLLVRGVDRDLPLADGPLYELTPGSGKARRVGRDACARVHANRQGALCLRVAANGFDYEAVVLDGRSRVRARRPVGGVPSRARVSRDGRYGAYTDFAVAGEGYYADTSRFSTFTRILDMRNGKDVLRLEDLNVRFKGRKLSLRDGELWGVTFGENGRYYATAAPGEGRRHLLIQGRVGSRRATVVASHVECPSLSPDGKRIAYKRRIGGSKRWRLHVRDLASGRTRALAESRSIDDQPEWLGDGVVAYSDGQAVYAVRTDGDGRPERLADGATSPVWLDR